MGIRRKIRRKLNPWKLGELGKSILESLPHQASAPIEAYMGSETSRPFRKLWQTNQTTDRPTDWRTEWKAKFHFQSQKTETWEILGKWGKNNIVTSCIRSSRLLHSVRNTGNIVRHICNIVYIWLFYISLASLMMLNCGVLIICSSPYCTALLYNVLYCNKLWHTVS